MGTELVKVSEVITPAVIVEQPTLPDLWSEKGRTAASPGRNSSTPSTTTRTRKKTL